MANIPKLIHFVWVGGNPLPRRFERNIATWVKHNPTYEIMRWDEKNIDFSFGFIQRAYSQKAWAKLSDFVRLLAVEKHGGIYLDTDIEVIQSFDRLLNYECFFGYQSLALNDSPVCNAAFGATPSHPFISEALGRFSTLIDGDLNKIGTGPEIISNLLLGAGLPHGVDQEVNVCGVTVLPRCIFYPYHWEEDFSTAKLTPETVAVHHWDMSWHSHEEWWVIRKSRSLLKSHPPVYRGATRLYRNLRNIFG